MPKCATRLDGPRPDVTRLADQTEMATPSELPYKALKTPLPTSSRGLDRWTRLVTDPQLAGAKRSDRIDRCRPPCRKVACKKGNDHQEQRHSGEYPQV